LEESTDWVTLADQGRACTTWTRVLPHRDNKAEEHNVVVTEPHGLVIASANHLVDEFVDRLCADRLVGVYAEVHEDDGLALMRQFVRFVVSFSGACSGDCWLQWNAATQYNQASGNRLAGRLFQTIHRAMLNMMILTSQLVELEHTLQFHKPILDAIEQRNSVLASSLMTEHLNDARNLLRQAARREAIAITAIISPSVGHLSRPPETMRIG
jgi:hypothetical protein